MTRHYLTRLTVEGFRGVNNEGDPLDLQFRPDVVNSVFAVNGIGKSSIFEAIHYAIFDEVPKLDLLQAQERPQDYFANRFHSQGVATIFLEFRADDGAGLVSILVRRDAAGNRTVSSPSGYSDPEAYLRSRREKFALLDYRQFARFIEDSPLERGRTFSSLLGLSSYSDRRQALQVISDSRTLTTDFELKVLATAKSAAQQAAQQALSTLRTTYERVTGNPLLDIARLDDYAIDVVGALSGVELLRPHLADMTLAEIDFDTIKAVIKTAEGGEKRRELDQTLQAIGVLEALSIYERAAIQGEQQSIEALIAERDELLSTTRGDLFKRLYEAARAIVVDGVWEDETQCPLCESQLGSSISTHITGQLTQYAAAARKSEEIKEAWQASQWKRCLEAFEETKAISVEAQRRKLAQLDYKIESGQVSQADIAVTMSWTSYLFDMISSQLNEKRGRKTVLESELPASLVQLTEQVEFGRQFQEALILYEQKRTEESELQKRLDVRERWKSFISQAAAVFSAAEAELSKEKIAVVADDYKEMFSDIMQVADVVPDLQRAHGREDLLVQLSNFHGQQRLSARALLSESYRNALAIAVFLAAAMKHSGAPRFVVLDDVTSSFDAGHQYFLMELIRSKLQQPNNPDGLQFIILSHDGLLEKYFDRLGNTSGWHHNKLQGAPPMGAILNQSQGADRLKTTITTLLTAGQTSQAQPLIRQYLEYKLQQIIRKLNIPVPIDFAIKDNSRMVGNCLDAINDAIGLHQRAGSLILDAQQITALDRVHVPAIVGNWVSHYETGSGSNLSAPVLSGVVGSIDALSECFRYDVTLGGVTTREWYRSLSRR